MNRFTILADGDNVAQIASLVGSLLGGGVLLKLFQVWTTHSRSVHGDFKVRTKAARDNFELVVSHLESRIEHLEESEQACLEKNRQLEKKIRTLEDKIERMILRSPWRDLSELPEPDDK